MSAVEERVAPLIGLGDMIESDVRSGWKANLNLTFVNRGDKTVVKHRSQSGPLAIQRPLYPDGTTCHTYLLHPPGGVVGGDTLSIDVTAESRASVLMTTPGATKFYRSDKRYAVQKQVLRVKADARLDWLPQENIFFPSAHARIDTEVHLESGAQFWGWEMHCFGRPALNEGFDAGQLVGNTVFFLDGRRVLTEGLNFSGGDNLMINKGLLGRSMIGSFYFTSDDPSELELVQSLLITIQQQLSDLQSDSRRTAILPLTIGVTFLDGLMVVRALADWSEDVLFAFSHIWQSVQQVRQGVAPAIPRIWIT